MAILFSGHELGIVEEVVLAMIGDSLIHALVNFLFSIVLPATVTECIDFSPEKLNHGITLAKLLFEVLIFFLGLQ